jgi:hypothetical protein
MRHDPKHVRNNQLGISINRRPRPAIPSAFSHLLHSHVLLLGIDERPNFIALCAGNAKPPHHHIVISSTSTSSIFQETENGMLAQSEHPARRVDGVSFDQGRYDLRSLRCV